MCNQYIREIIQTVSPLISLATVSFYVCYTNGVDFRARAAGECIHYLESHGAEHFSGTMPALKLEAEKSIHRIENFRLWHRYKADPITAIEQCINMSFPCGKHMLLPNLANEELARFSIMVFGMSRISFFLFCLVF